MTDRERMAETARAFIKGLASGSIDDTLVTEDLACWANGNEFDLPRLRMMIGLLSRLFPSGLAIEPGDPLVEGERAAVMARSHGVLDDGEVYANDYHYAFRFRDGRICEMREYMDTGLVARLLAPRLQALMAAPGASKA